MKRLKEEAKSTLPSKYAKKFKKAFLTFKFQLVYCPKEQELVHLNSVEDHEYGEDLKKFDDWKFLGKNLTKETA